MFYIPLRKSDRYFSFLNFLLILYASVFQDFYVANSGTGKQKGVKKQTYLRRLLNALFETHWNLANSQQSKS